MAKQERWASRVGLVLAMAGNAVGLGNFLRFPAQAAANGGGAFLIPYIVALILLGLPLIWVEWSMGRFGGQHGHHSTPGIFDTLGNRRAWWKYLGVFGLFTNLLVAAYYLYIESWTISYSINALIGGFTGPQFDGPEGIGRVFDFYSKLTGEDPRAHQSVFAISPWGLGVFLLCIIINISILSRGLAKGIELVSKIGMPLLIVFAAILAVRGLMIDPKTDAAAVASPFVGLNFVWEPKFESLKNPSVWLAAAGQIFFTLSIGMGSIHCYASYLREQDDVALTGTSAAWTNQFCEVVLGGTILIPIAVAYLGLADVQQRSGFSLGFFVFPTLFNKWGAFAPVAGFLWFGLLFFAAITSSLAMGQPIMAFLQQEYGLSRPRSAVAFGALLLPLALPVAMFTQRSFFDEFDYWVGTFSLVVFALIESILFAWVFGMERGWAEIRKGAELRVPGFFYYVIKYITPLFLILILIGYAFQPRGTVSEVNRETGQVVTRDDGWSAYFEAWTNGKPAPAWDWSPDGMIGKLLYRDLQAPPDETPEAKSYREGLVVMRTIDRLVMVGAFTFFCILVRKAWVRRRAEGRA
ncbi:MAG TPA: sodium-dependent transporter [Gemmatales bacterium]|nr:sodium-dependent transporter [Gemmatales bacterium]